MSQAQPAQLKRSQKTDFTSPTNHPSILMRERSFVKASKDAMKRRSQTMATIKTKPTMELYRPPNVRPEGQNTGKLNVHAKEFTMNHELHPSKSSGNLVSFDTKRPLLHSKSSGNILKAMNHPNLVQIMPTPIHVPLLHSSSHHLLNHLPRISLYDPQNANDFFGHTVFANHHAQPTPQWTWNNVYNNANINNNNNAINNSKQQLKRSKSLGAADARNLPSPTVPTKTLTEPSEADLRIFSKEDQVTIKQALEDPNQLPSRSLMDLVKVIMEKIIESIRYCETGAKICMAVIEREKNKTFLESLLNTCQQWYNERDKILRGIRTTDGTRFTAFMWFLTEMCSQLKRHQLKEEFESLKPDLVILSVLAKCCQACVSLPIQCVSETECLFFVLTSIGRDLESELPDQLEQLLASVRDGFLSNSGSPAVNRTLLQLIELHASNWQLPGSSVLYYYPRSN